MWTRDDVILNSPPNRNNRLRRSVSNAVNFLHVSGSERSATTMKRVMLWKRTPGGKVLTCTHCSWWAPLMEPDVNAVIKNFDAHVCADHPPLKETEKPSPK